MEMVVAAKVNAATLKDMLLPGAQLLLQMAPQQPNSTIHVLLIGAENVSVGLPRTTPTLTQGDLQESPPPLSIPHQWLEQQQIQ